MNGAHTQARFDMKAAIFDNAVFEYPGFIDATLQVDIREIDSAAVHTLERINERSTV